VFLEYILLIPIIAWFVAQSLKLVFSPKKLPKNGGYIFASGGMPSAHSSFISALTVAIGFKEGFFSTLFALSLCVMGIVIYDAIHVRLEAGKHAQVLNIIDDSRSKSFLPLREHLGHTFYEALAGTVLGLALGTLLSLV